MWQSEHCHRMCDKVKNYRIWCDKVKCYTIWWDKVMSYRMWCDKVNTLMELGVKQREHNYKTWCYNKVNTDTTQFYKVNTMIVHDVEGGYISRKEWYRDKAQYKSQIQR